MGYPSDEDELWDDIARWCKLAMHAHYGCFGTTLYPDDVGWCVNVGDKKIFKDERRGDAVRKAARWCRENMPPC